jgi:hypothetical protein
MVFNCKYQSRRHHKAFPELLSLLPTSWVALRISIYRMICNIRVVYSVKSARQRGLIPTYNPLSYLYIIVRLNEDCYRYPHSRSSIQKLASAAGSRRIALREESPMRADLTFMALAHESNRFLLSRLIAKATRKLHRPNTRLQDTMNDAFERFGCSKPGAAAVMPEPSALRRSRAA